MKFWDSSALVPIIFDEPSSARIRELADDGEGIEVWWGSIVECTSAMARRERRGELDAAALVSALAFLDRLADGWIEVPPSDRIRDEARRIVSIHDLRTADAFQLAAVRVASDGQPASLPFVTLDDRLALAAVREGFRVVDLGL